MFSMAAPSPIIRRPVPDQRMFPSFSSLRPPEVDCPFASLLSTEPLRFSTPVGVMWVRPDPIISPPDHWNEPSTFRAWFPEILPPDCM